MVNQSEKVPEESLVDESTISPTETVRDKPRTHQRKRRNNPDDHGNSWAKGIKWDFLESRLHLYYDACNSKTWDGFYENTVDAWVRQGFKIEDIGKTPMPVGTPGDDGSYSRQLRKRAKNCVKYWYKNRKAKPQNGGAGHKKLKYLLKNGKQRALQLGQGYCHLYYEDPDRNMRQKVEEGYAQHLNTLKANEKPMGKLNYRMQLAREMLAKESTEVQQRVDQYCKSVNNPDYDEKHEYANYPEEEQNRLANALVLRRNSESIPQMTRAFLDAIFEATGFRGVVGLVGPDTLAVDNAAHSFMQASYILSKGRTKESNMSFERYSSDDYQTFLTALEHWGGQCITDQERKAYSLKPEVDPIIPPASFDVVKAISNNNTSSTQDEPGDLSLNFDDSRSDDSEDGESGSASIMTTPPSCEQEKNVPNFDTYQDLLGQDSHSFDWDPALLMPTEHTLLSRPDAHPQQAPLYQGPSFMSMPSLPQVQPIFAHIDNQPAFNQVLPSATFDMSSMMQSELVANHTLPSQAVFAPTSTAKGNYDKNPNPAYKQGSDPGSSFLASADMLPEPIHETICVESNSSFVLGSYGATDHPDTPIPSITPMHTSNKENLSPNTNSEKSKTTRKKVIAPKPKIRAPVTKNAGDPSWCLVACDHLRRSLKGPDACEAVAHWKGLEELLGYPGMTKKLSESIAQNNAPICLREYITAGRSEDFEPERNVEDVSQQFKVFWRTLQPDWRRKTNDWPMTKQSAEAADWSKLMKGGPNGIFLVLKVLSFWAKMAWTCEERREFDETVADVNWVLGEIMKQVNGGSVLGVRKRRG